MRSVYHLVGRDRIFVFGVFPSVANDRFGGRVDCGLPHPQYERRCYNICNNRHSFVIYSFFIRYLFA